MEWFLKYSKDLNVFYNVEMYEFAIQLGQKIVIIIGTVHMHEESVNLVRTTLREVRPDYVAVELDPKAYRNIFSIYIRYHFIN